MSTAGDARLGGNIWTRCCWNGPLPRVLKCGSRGAWSTYEPGAATVLSAGSAVGKTRETEELKRAGRHRRARLVGRRAAAHATGSAAAARIGSLRLQGAFPATARLPPGLMPLLAFPGGYGGMVHSDHGRVSLSCCIRRDPLERCRRRSGAGAGESVLAHIKAACGPLARRARGRRARRGMALGWPDTPRYSVDESRRRLSGRQRRRRSAPGRGRRHQHGDAIGLAARAPSHGSRTCRRTSTYAADWHRMFARRIYAAAVIAHWAMRPAAVALALPLLNAFPAVLTEGARTSGKVTAICSPSF